MKTSSLLLALLVSAAMVGIVAAEGDDPAVGGNVPDVYTWIPPVGTMGMVLNPALAQPITASDSMTWGGNGHNLKMTLDWTDTGFMYKGYSMEHLVAPMSISISGTKFSLASTPLSTLSPKPKVLYNDGGFAPETFAIQYSQPVSWTDTPGSYSLYLWFTATRTI